MRIIKDFARKILNAIDPGLETQVLAQYSFNRLNRKPPELMWRALKPGSVPRLDAGRIQLGDELFVFGGFGRHGAMHSFVDIFNMRLEKWEGRFAMPANMPQSHLGMASDGHRYIFSVSGQLGNECHPAVKSCFIFDAHKKEFKPFIGLPEARYAPAVAYWHGRLHVMGGSKGDRNTPADDHWSIAASGEQSWRREIPVPRGGPHRACVAVGEKLFILGGQEGDYIPVAGDPGYKCTGLLTNEDIYGDCFVLDKKPGQWKTIAPMPVKVSHTEFSCILLDHRIILLGGMYDKNPKTKYEQLTDAIQVYDTRTDSWSVAGHLPYRAKSVLAGYCKGEIYFTAGQRDNGIDDPSPGQYELRTWKAHFFK